MLNSLNSKRARIHMLIFAFFMLGFHQIQLYTSGGIGYNQACTKRLGKEFSPTEIENGVLKDLITEADYDIITVVST